MNVESIPKFTDPAAKLWATIPADTKKLLLANVPRTATERPQRICWCVFHDYLPLTPGLASLRRTDAENVLPGCGASVSIAD